MNTEDWDAIVACDQSFDGRFYYGVITTGIFCRPSCKSRTPRPENVKIYEHSTQALRDGLRPCKRCRPDLLIHHNSKQEMVERAVHLISEHYTSDLTLEEIAERIYVSAAYLQKAFKQQMGVSPFEYMTKMRIDAAKELLLDVEMSVTDVALHVGYKNPAHFSIVFRKHQGYPPSKHKERTT